MSDIFDPASVTEAPVQEYPVAEPGTYRAVVEHAEVRDNSQNTGRFVQINMTLIDQPHKGVKASAYLNFEHKSAQAQNIGRSQLKRFLASIGISKPVDLQQIADVTRNKITTVEVGLDEYKGKKRNTVLDFIDTGDSLDVPF